jgi:hypothetical protein
MKNRKSREAEAKERLVYSSSQGVIRESPIRKELENTPVYLL